MSFVHLHVHTEFSLLDGACTIKKMMPLLKEMGQNAVAMTDHGNMYGTIKFYEEAKKAGIKPIIGCEVYTAPRTRFDKVKELDGNYGHLVLLCKNNEGYKNLIKIVSFSNLEGFYYKPRVDFELLEKYHENLICLSACLAGDVQQKLLANDYEGAKALALKYLGIFGEGNYYLELQDHFLEEDKTVNEGLIRISRETGIPLVATNDAHYLQKKDARAQKVLVCVQIQKTVDEDNGMGFETEEFYLKSEEEMRALFEYVPEAIDNTQKIADMCDIEFPVIDGTEKVKYILPDFKWTDGLSHYEYFRKMAFEGFEYRYKPEERTQERIDRLNYELSVINQMGFVDYYLIVWDFIKFAKDHGIPIGPGRGSGAGSMVAYCLKITNIEPIRFALIFERFLNPERISMPDFDIDICTERRGEVIEYVKRKYGEQNVAQIITFGTMKAKMAVKDVSRALGLPLQTANAVAKLIPEKMNIKESIEAVPELKSMYETDNEIRELLDMCESIENSPRHTSVHAAGVVITEDPTYTYAPLGINEGMAVIQFDMVTTERIGLVKMDFLGLRNLTVIEDACKLIRRQQPGFLIENINYEDKETFDMLSQGKTEGVFQLESGGMKNVLMQLHPKSLEDITAVISLYRPGPMDSIPTYVDNSFHPEKVTYKHPLLKNILSVTYGCMVYQEQVMEIVRTLAGYSYGRADLVRRAMGKKKIDVMKQEREYFINGKLAADGSIEVPGSVRNGVPAEVADQIFDEMVKFAQYAFNKSHAAAYAFVSYYTAYLMCHHKKEYMAALLTSVVTKPDKMVGYIVACQGHNIDMLPPDVNKSESVFSVEENGIRFGLIGLKGMGKNVVDAIIEERAVAGPFLNFYDFCKRMLSSHDLDSRSVECLIKCGAFDSFGLKRRQLEIAYPEVKKALQVVIKQEREGQMSLFGGMEEEQQDNFEYPDVEEYPKKLKLSYEKEIAGVYLSDHPMKEYAEIIAERDLPTVADLNSDDMYKNNSRVSIIGIVSKFTKKMTKSETMMGIMQVQDLTGNIEVLLFSKTFDKYSHEIEEDAVVQITGKLSKPEETAPTSDDNGEEGGFAETAKLIAAEISKVDSPNDVSVSAPTVTQKKQEQYLSIMITKNDMSYINKCAEIIESSPGTSKVFFTFTDMGKQARFRTDVQISDKLISSLSEILGHGKVEAKNL